MKQLLEIFSTTPSLYISAPIALIGAYFGIQSWRINRIRLGLDQAKFYQDFTQAIESLKRIYDLARRLKIHQHDDISIENLMDDKKILDEIIISIDKYEDKFKVAYFTMQLFYQTRDQISEFSKELSLMNQVNFEDKIRLSSKFGLIYFSIFMLSPNVYPKTVSSDEIKKDLNHKIFMEYYSKLVWGKY